MTSCAEPEPEQFGTVRIEVEPLNGVTDIFNGTTSVSATVHYEACLQDFYLNRMPTHQIDGTEGSAVFAEWTERLCSSEFSDIPDCEVTDITQNLFGDNEVYSLVITYKILDPSTIPYREFRVGPLPTEEFAGCPSGVRPRVELRQSGLLGKDAAGSNIWRISTLPASNAAVAEQGAPLRVEVIAN